MKFKVLVIPFLMLTSVGCVPDINIKSNKYSHIKKINVEGEVYLSEKGVIKELNSLEVSLKSRILGIERKIKSLEKSQALKSNNLVVSKGVKWACILSPHFEKRKFIASSYNKTEATFVVIEKCKQAGVDEFRCREHNVQCSDN